MAINIQLPTKKQLKEITRTKYEVPVDQIIKTLGANPLAQGIDSGTKDFSEALDKRYKLQQQVLGIKAITKAYDLPEGTLDNVPYESAATVGATIYKKPEKNEVLYDLNKDGSPVDIITKQPILQMLPNVKYTRSKSDDDATDKTRVDSKEQARQDKLEKIHVDRLDKILSNRSGGLGLQDSKVNQAVHLRTMANAAYNKDTSQFDLPEMQTGEMVMGLANLVSGSNISNMEQLKSITPKTARGDAAHLISYWTGQPLTTQPQAMIKNLISAIDRQGTASEQLRDRYVSTLKNYRPSGLDPEIASGLEANTVGSSFSDILKASPDYKAETLQLPRQKTSGAATHRWNPATGKVEIIQ